MEKYMRCLIAVLMVILAGCQTATGPTSQGTLTVQVTPTDRFVFKKGESIVIAWRCADQCDRVGDILLQIWVRPEGSPQIDSLFINYGYTLDGTYAWDIGVLPRSKDRELLVPGSYVIDVRTTPTINGYGQSSLGSSRRIRITG